MPFADLPSIHNYLLFSGIGVADDLLLFVQQFAF